MEPRLITNTENIINTRDLFTRINWLEQALNYRCSDEFSEELKVLKEFAGNIEDVASVTTYDEGTDLVRDSYLEEYQAMEDPDKGNAPLSPVDFKGVNYWLRH